MPDNRPLVLMANSLKSIAENLVTVADLMLQAEYADTEKPSASVTEPEPTVTKEEVRAVLIQKNREYSGEIHALLEKYGASRLSELDPKYYAAVLQEAKVIGNAT